MVGCDNSCSLQLSLAEQITVYVRLCLCLTNHHHLKSRRNEVIAPNILNLGTSCKLRPDRFARGK
jgi:hypothetical protein